MKLQMVSKHGYWIYIVFLSALFGFISCRQSIVDHKQMEAYIEKSVNGLTKANDDKKIKVSVTFRPSDFLVEQQLQSMKPFTRQTIDSLRTMYGRNIYFVLHLAYRDKEVLTGFADDVAKFSDMVDKFSFEMGNYVSLTTEKGDTLQLLDFVYPRMYGMSGSTDIMFSFENKIKPGTNELNFNLSEFGLNTGKMQFPFKVKDIASVPHLNIMPENGHTSPNKEKSVNDTIKQQTKK